MKTLTSLFFLFFTLNASAQECLSMIELSKTVSTTISDQETVESHARNFCNSYSSGTTSTSNSSFGASYKFLSASYGKSNVSVETIASQYCDASQGSQSAKDAYKQYVENISPNAYSAYVQCLAMTQSDLVFDVDTASILPKQFSMSASYSSHVTGSNSASLDFSSSDGIQCKWRKSNGSEIVLPSPSSTILDCRRNNSDEKGIVKIFRTDATSTKPLTLQWPKYDSQGNPVDTLERIQQRVNDIESGVSKIESRILSFGKTVNIIDANFAQNSASSFVPSEVPLNTLFPANPTSSDIIINESGLYLATTTIRVCVSGSNNYISAFVNYNGKVVANSVNVAKECGSAVATISLQAEPKDLISGLCAINQIGIGGTCTFSLTLISSGTR